MITTSVDGLEPVSGCELGAPVSGWVAPRVEGVGEASCVGNPDIGVGRGNCSSSIF